jgi:beta-glucosidase
MPKNIFPKDFLWGASTASYQVEGGLHTQWSEWERINANKLARNAKDQLRFLSKHRRNIDWQSISDLASKPENYIAGQGIDHFNRYKEDFKLLKLLNMNSFRFGIEWARLQPAEGVWDKQAIAHYHRYISELKKQKIEPVLTIWHWTMPTWFTDKGGFSKHRNIKFFDDLVYKITIEFAKDIKYIIVLNEPNVYSGMSYVLGIWPPQHKNLITGLKVYINLGKAHKRAYSIIKKNNSSSNVGIAMNLSQAYAISPHNPINILVVKLKDYIWNWWFLNRIRNQLDFIGINFYQTEYLNWRLKLVNPEQPISDLGWYMKPDALGDLLISTFKRYKLPLIVTENGLADAKDKHRKWWLKQTIEAMGIAIENGVTLMGYLHWSLLDNFEWSFGWWPRFGLIEVDRKNMKRKVRPSAKWLASEIDKKSKRN